MHKLSLIVTKTKNGDRYIIDSINNDYKEDKYNKIFRENNFNLFKGKYYLRSTKDDEENEAIYEDAKKFIEDFNAGMYDDEELYPQLELELSKGRNPTYKILGPSNITYKFRDDLNKYFRFFKDVYYLNDIDDYESAAKLINIINKELKEKYESKNVSAISPKNLRRTSLKSPKKKKVEVLPLQGESFLTEPVMMNGGRYFVNVRVSYIPDVKENNLRTHKGTYTFKKALDRNQPTMKFATDEGPVFEFNGDHYQNVRDREEVIL